MHPRRIIPITLLLMAAVAVVDSASATGVLQMNHIGIAYVKTGDSLSQKHAVYEVFDHGRFLVDKKVFARIRIPQYWLRAEMDKTWRTIDLQAPTVCTGTQYAGGTTQFGECLAEYVQERSECTPWNVDGCAVTLRVTLNESFVDATLRLHNGSYVIATKAQWFDKYEDGAITEVEVPSSGVALANLPEKTRLNIRSGVSKISGDTQSKNYALVPVKTTPLGFADAMTLAEMEECGSYYVLGGDPRPLIASGCRSALWRAITNLSAVHVALFLALVVLLALLAVTGVLVCKFLRNRQFKKPGGFRGLSGASRAELGMLTTADRTEPEVKEDETVEMETVISTPKGMKYTKVAAAEPKKPQPKKTSQLQRKKSNVTFAVAEQNGRAPEDPVPPTAGTSGVASGGGAKRSESHTSFWKGTSFACDPKDVIPADDDSGVPVDGTSSDGELDSDVESEEPQSEANGKDGKKKEAKTPDFTSLRVTEFVRRVITGSDHSKNQEWDIDTMVTKEQWQVIGDALMGVCLEMVVQPHLTGRFEDLILDPSTALHLTQTDSYRARFEQPLKHSNLPLVLLARFKKFPIPLDLLRTVDRTNVVEASVDRGRRLLGHSGSR